MKSTSASQRTDRAMSLPTRSNRKLLYLTLALLGSAGLVAGYLILGTGQDRSVGSSDAAPSDYSASSGESAAGPDTTPVPAAESPASPSETATAGRDSQLQEAQLDHLNEVFLNTVYPLFQSDFQLDRESRAAIDVFVASLPEGLESEDLEAVTALIETQLRTPAAEDLAFIITHLYRLEQEEARLLGDADAVTTMEGQLKAQEQLSRLRDEWFGPELSEQLFSETDETIAEEEPPETLTEDQTELADIEGTWDRRYQQFLEEKQVIDRAGLDPAEKDRQIETLLQQHYSPREIEAARAYGDLQE